MNKRAAKAVMEEDGVLLLHYEVNRRLLDFLSGSTHFQEYYHRRSRKEKAKDKKAKWWKLLKERFEVLWTDLKAVERGSGSEISRKYDEWMVLRSPSLQQSVKHHLFQQRHRTEQTRGEDRDRTEDDEEGEEYREAEQHAWRELMQLWRDSVQNEVMLLQKKVKAVAKDIKQEGAKYTNDKKGKEVSAMMEELVEDIFRFRFGRDEKAEATEKIDTKVWRELLTGSLFSTLDESVGRCLFLWEDSQQQSKKRQRQEWQRLKRCLNPVAVVDSCVACFRKKGFLLDKDFFLNVLRQECSLSNRNGKTEKEVVEEQEHEGAEEEMGEENGEDLYILYRGTSSVDEDSTSWKTKHNPLGAHSLSFGSGIMHDKTAVPYHHICKRNNQGYALCLPKKDLYLPPPSTSSSSFNELFYIPPLSCLVQLFAIGEFFHPRTRVSLPTTLEEEGEHRGGKRATFNERENNGVDGLLPAETEPQKRSRATPPSGFVSGILSCAYTSLPMFLMTNLSPPSLESKWRATAHQLRVALPKINK
ncbi:hypothetical protein QOT17_013237 [Balamuthia mandrillaris]